MKSEYIGRKKREVKSFTYGGHKAELHFESIKLASEFVRGASGNIVRAIKRGGYAYGWNWAYVGGDEKKNEKY